MRAYIFNMFMGLFLTSSMVFAQPESGKQIGQARDWSVFKDENPTQCWAVSVPDRPAENTKDKRKVSVKRGDIQFMVQYNPANKVRGQVSFTGGYTFAEGSKVNLSIDGKNFGLATNGEWAWPIDAAADIEVVAAMKRGKAAVLTARSSRGTTTKDTFSLLGFTDAVEDAAKRCGG